MMAMFTQDPLKRIRLDDIVKHDWVTQGSIPEHRELYQFLHPNITSIHLKQVRRSVGLILSFITLNISLANVLHFFLILAHSLTDYAS